MQGWALVLQCLPMQELAQESMLAVALVAERAAVEAVAMLGQS